MRSLMIACLSFFFANVYAFNWTDLWLTQNQQAQIKMNKGQFKQAEATFQRSDWRGTAAYRAGNYGQAVKHYSTLHTESGFYNEGNALAHLGKYEEAIKAYNAALALNPKHEDALFNRKLVQDLLKKNKNQQNQNQQGKNQQDQNPKDQSQQNKDQQDQNQENKNQQNKDQQGQNQENKNQQNQEQQNQNQKKDKDQQNKQDQQDKQQQNKAKPKPNEADKMQSAEKLEKQQAKEQWLRLIPDDPGGLLREKFLRDHLRREEGWYQ